MITNNIKQTMLEMAKTRFPDQTILPCGNCTNLDQCFTVDENQYIFWFNISGDNSTKIISINQYLRQIKK